MTTKKKTKKKTTKKVGQFHLSISDGSTLQLFVLCGQITKAHHAPREKAVIVRTCPQGTRTIRLGRGWDGATLDLEAADQLGRLLSAARRWAKAQA